MPLSRHMYAIAGFAALLTASSFGTGHLKPAAKTQPQSVLVVNPTNNPVHVSGPVTVSSLPAVQIDGSTTVKVHEAGAPGRQFISKANSLSIPDGEVDNASILYTVPTGKRLIIKDMWGQAILPSGQACNDLTIADGTETFEFHIPLQYQGTGFSGNPFYDGAMNGCEFVFNAGSDIQISAQRTDTTDTARVLVGFTGYLEDAS